VLEPNSPRWLCPYGIEFHFIKEINRSGVPLVDMASQVEILLRKERKIIASRTLEQGSYIIGNAGADIVLPDPGIASRHVCLTLNSEGLFLEALGSATAISLNGVKIHERVRLLPAQVAKLGHGIELEMRLIGRESDRSERCRSTQRPKVSCRSHFSEVKNMRSGSGRGGRHGSGTGSPRNGHSRKVAMKVMGRRESKGADEQYSRFVSEARITALLEHPNIVPVHDLGVDKQDEIYYTMS
jgi:serine/threonine protein kinase